MMSYYSVCTLTCVHDWPNSINKLTNLIKTVMKDQSPIHGCKILSIIEVVEDHLAFQYMIIAVSI